MQVLISTITIDRDQRQRRDLKNIPDLAHSLKTVGQISPIVLDDTGKLIAGERRLTAAKSLGWEWIEAVTMSDLSPTQAALVELEENVKREDLTWEETVTTYHKISAALETLHPEWSGKDVAEYLGLSHNYYYMVMEVANALCDDPPQDLSAFTSIRAAHNFLSRQTSRAIDGELEKLLAPNPTPVSTEVQADLDLNLGPDDSGPQVEGLPPPRVLHQPQSLLAPSPIGNVVTADFLEWAPTYSGERFNLIHCDFPYGVGHHKTAQGGAKRHGSYADTKDTYITLLDSFLRNRDSFMAASAHIIFWYSLTYDDVTRDMFEDLAPEIVVDPFPLIWFKPDNVGILPDPTRGPRRVYETALFARRGDRKIVKAVGNCKAHPGAKDDMIHISEKPAEMLSHFFRMCVDPTTRMLDPTAGSAASLVAAHRLGCTQFLGLELDPEYAAKANTRLQLEMSK